MNWQQIRENWKQSSDRSRDVSDVLPCIGDVAIDDLRRRFAGQAQLHCDSSDDEPVAPMAAWQSAVRDSWLAR